jgi:hypothetical protein
MRVTASLPPGAACDTGLQTWKIVGFMRLLKPGETEVVHGVMLDHPASRYTLSKNATVSWRQSA